MNALRDGYHIQNESSPVSMHQGYATVSSRLSEAPDGTLPKHRALGLGMAQAGSFQSKRKPHRKERKRTKNVEKQNRENPQKDAQTHVYLPQAIKSIDLRGITSQHGLYTGAPL